MQIPGLQLDGSLDHLAWRSTRYEGIAWLDLAELSTLEDAVIPMSSAQRGGDEASMTVLIRMDPGRGYPRHRHLGPEDVLVLAGGYQDEDGRTFSAGTFVRYPAGSTHAPTAKGDPDAPVAPSNPACILLAVAHGGTEPAEDDRPHDGAHK